MTRASRGPSGLERLERLSGVAWRAPHERRAVVGPEDLARASARAVQNARSREMLNLHAGDDEALHRMVNAVEPGSYIPPHRHLHPPKDECFVLLSGDAGFVLFDDHGGEEYILLSTDREDAGMILDIRPGVWHSLLALAPGTTLFEVKPGPYDPLGDKDFAPFAPRGDDPGAGLWLADLEDRLRLSLDLGPRAWKPN